MRALGGRKTAYDYDAAGNLLAVAMPGGPSIEYAVDGWNRKIARRVNGVLERGWLYGDARRPIAELDGAPATSSRCSCTPTPP